MQCCDATDAKQCFETQISRWAERVAQGTPRFVAIVACSAMAGRDTEKELEVGMATGATTGSKVSKGWLCHGGIQAFALMQPQPAGGLM